MENDKISSENTVKNIPHIAQITVNAIVNQQLPDGKYHPRAVYNDAFAISLTGNNAEECIEKLKEKMEKIKNA